MVNLRKGREQETGEEPFREEVMLYNPCSVLAPGSLLETLA